MKRRLRRAASCAAALIVAAGCLLARPQAAEAAKPQTTEKTYAVEMKKAPLKWDLKNNKTVYTKIYIPGVGMRGLKYRITDYKMTTRNGYKECTFTFWMMWNWKLTSREVYKWWTAGDTKETARGWGYYRIVDGKTGRRLLAGNDKNVTVTANYTSYTYGTFRDSYGHAITPNNQKHTVRIVFPATYKDMCLVCGGTSCGTANYTENDRKFENGLCSFNKAKHFYNKKNKNLTHAMRIK